MALKGIIFDKDGTLIDYYSVWAPVFRNSTDMILDRVGRSGDEELRRNILLLLGIDDHGVYPKGLVFDSSSTLMLVKMWIFAKKWNISFRKLFRAFKEGYNGSREMLKDSIINAKPTGDVKRLFSRLKDAGYKIGLATSDNLESTELCLKILDIRDYFDFISTYDDHYRKKPHPESFNAFCDAFSLRPSEVAVVGDAVVDLHYGRKAKSGYNVAVLTGSGDYRRLSRKADAVYADLDELHDDPQIFSDK